jgi:hypothetical protein
MTHTVNQAPSLLRHVQCKSSSIPDVVEVVWGANPRLLWWTRGVPDCNRAVVRRPGRRCPRIVRWMSGMVPLVRSPRRRRGNQILRSVGKQIRRQQRPLGPRAWPHQRVDLQLQATSHACCGGLWHSDHDEQTIIISLWQRERKDGRPRGDPSSESPLLTRRAMEMDHDGVRLPQPGESEMEIDRLSLSASSHGPRPQGDPTVRNKQKGPYMYALRQLSVSDVTHWNWRLQHPGPVRTCGVTHGQPHSCVTCPPQRPWTDRRQQAHGHWPSKQGWSRQQGRTGGLLAAACHPRCLPYVTCAACRVSVSRDCPGCGRCQRLYEEHITPPYSSTNHYSFRSSEKKNRDEKLVEGN